jgi:hypothetical protein
MRGDVLLSERRARLAREAYVPGKQVRDTIGAEATAARGWE